MRQLADQVDVGFHYLSKVENQKLDFGGLTYIVTQLPELTTTSNDTDIAEYAKRTYVPVAWVRKRLAEKKTLARSLAAIPIEVDHKPWGVIVIDSTEPSGVKIQANAKDVALFMLGKLLKRS